ncbi:hypothetical protein NJB18001_15220 [Mycobacterium marinum]|uniref:hypothetical protein n=1 Tax=Mycobacterium marinum TaxID=1781 RepID=UPI0021C2A6F3|nr:hypothetical protein [Mycobacterium marinum]GJP00117.1 hypothetical protein NJB18001_15220 [Mycobacterium marinum]
MSYPHQPAPYPHDRPPHQAYPPAPHGYVQPSPGSGGIAVTTQYFPLGFMLALFKPKIFINGFQVPVAGWGRTVVPVQPGLHRVHVHVPYWLPSQIGPADTLVDVYPGQLAELEYKAPVWGYSAGSLGTPPQSYNGVGITIAVLTIVAALVFVLPIIVALFLA